MLMGSFVAHIEAELGNVGVSRLLPKRGSCDCGDAILHILM